MKIQGVPAGAEGMKPVGGKNAQDVKSAKQTDRTRSARTTQQVDGYERHEALTSPVESEFEPRMELLEQVSQRISAGVYNRSDVMEQVAERIVAEQVGTEMTEEGEEAPIQSERLDKVGENVVADYYERPEVQYEIARKVLAIVHPSRIAGDGGVV